MAISNTNLVQTKKPLSLPLLAFITFFFMLLNRVNSSDSLSFTFNNFKPNQEDLILQGDAKIPSSKRESIIELTKIDSKGKPVGSSVGRALYIAPFFLWEKTTGKVASFETSFTFEISSPTTNAGDGLAFFIAPPGTTIPPNSAGGYLGLVSGVVTDSNQVVAVEFDTYSDRWDPSYRHIGIDINSVVSSSSKRWEWINGTIATAHIKYNSANEELSVVSTYPNGESVTLSHVIDLKSILPEWVRIGFSGSTGASKQTNNILSWSFSSSLKSSKFENEDMYIARYM